MLKNNKPAETHERQVARSASDLKELIHYYNIYDPEKQKLPEKDTIRFKEMRKECAIILKERLNLDVNAEDFWNDTHLHIKPGLIYKRSSETKKFEIVEDEYNLDDILEALPKDCEFITLIRTDDEFATELYAALCNMMWVKNGITWMCSWRYAGGLVADIRNKGEDYMHFYCSGGEGTVSDRIREHLKKLGWEPSEFDEEYQKGN